jgi:outer membrane protein assembly factor BamE (lipoprotein component of BamABCDE complex)
VIVGLVVLMLAIAGGMTWAVATGKVRSVALGEQIKKGMTITELDSILGSPSVVPPAEHYRMWYFHDGAVFVALDDDQRCESARAIDVEISRRPGYWLQALTGW